MAVVRLDYCKHGVPDQLHIDMRAPEYRGGEGNIYFSKDGLYAVKIYKRQGESAAKRQFLRRIMLLSNSLTEEEQQFLCYPVALIKEVDGTPYVGCVTPRIPTPPYKKLIDVIFGAKQAYAQFQAGLSWGNYLQVARGIARSVAVLNGRGCAHTDIDFLNFLVNAENGSVVMLDLDGSVVPGFLPPQVLGKTGWMAPELMAHEAAPSERSDRHSLAVLVLHALLFRNVMEPLLCYDPEDRDKNDVLAWGREAVFSEHPTDRRNRPEWFGPMFEGGRLSYRILSPALQRLTERALVEGLRTPDRRPSAQEWVNALGWALDELWRCSNCRLHFPYPHWLNPAPRRRCPFCGEASAVPLPSVLLLYEPRNKGNYRFIGRHLVLGGQSRLFADVLDPGRNPPMTRKSEPTVGYVEWDQKGGVNRLVNDEETIWQARSGTGEPTTALARGTSVPLTPGTTIHFGEGRRLLLVAE